MNKQEQSIAVAKLYYESDMSQQEIAKQLELSRPTVSRLLQYAKDHGFVEIKIHDPEESLAVLEGRLQERFHLKAVRVAASALATAEEEKKAMGKAAAEYLVQNVKDGDVLGVGWGQTLYAMSEFLPLRPLQNVTVVQLKGGISLNSNQTYAYEILNQCAKAFNGQGYYLPLPVMFDTVQVKELVEQDKFIKKILDLGRQANIAVFTVGPATDMSSIFHLGYYINDVERNYIEAHAVGDIVSRFYDAQGKICGAAIDARTVGISLDDLKAKEQRVLVAGGSHKIQAIRAALQGKFANVFITDQYTAKTLLTLK